MINFRKAGLLIVTLVIPALVFVFLKLFATNHYDLPRYHPQLDSSGRVMVNYEDTLFYMVPGIHLKNVSGNPVTENFGKGKISVVGYLPENCDETCKIVLDQVARVFALKENIPNLTLFTIAEKWASKNSGYPDGFNSDNWPVITGSREEVNHALELLKFETNVPKAKTNSIESKLVLIDVNGHIRGYYNLADVEETDRLMAEIKILDYEKKLD